MAADPRRSRRGYSSGRGGEFYHHQPATTTRFPVPIYATVSADLCYARQGRQYTIRFYQANTGFSVAAQLLPLSSASRFSARKSCGSRAVAANPRFSRASRHRGGKSVPDKKGEGNELQLEVGGDVVRTKGGSEVFAGERGMRGSVSACT